MYDYYTSARDRAWQVLIECNIRRLPVDLLTITEHYNIPVVQYSSSVLAQSLSPNALMGDGFVATIGNEGSQKVIFINDKIANYKRRRFTLAHEIGHAVMGHDLTLIHYRHSELDESMIVQELQANIVARNILMPATVLEALDIHTPEEIMKLCGISKTSAEIRAERMVLLRNRNMFNRHPLERQVRAQFEPFIEQWKQTNKNN